MTELHPGDDRLLDLVNGLLSEEDRRRTLEHLRGCEGCGESLRELGATHERAHSRLAATSGSSASRSMRHAPPRRASLGRRRVLAALVAVAAAAALAISFVGGPTWRGPHPVAPRPEEVAWLPVPEPTIFQRDSSLGTADARLISGLRAYRERDAKAAARLLARAPVSGPLEQVRRIYLGSAQLQLGRSVAALRTLRGVELDQVPEPWRSEAIWALISAYSGTGQIAAADSLLRSLSSRSDEIGERARRALSRTIARP